MKNDRANAIISTSSIDGLESFMQQGFSVYTVARRRAALQQISNILTALYRSGPLHGIYTQALALYTAKFKPAPEFTYNIY